MGIRREPACAESAWSWGRLSTSAPEQGWTWRTFSTSALSRANYEGDCGQAPQSRAEITGAQYGDRASQGGVPHGDRALQGGHQHGDRALHVGDQHGDRAVHGSVQSLGRGHGQGLSAGQDEGLEQQVGTSTMMPTSQVGGEGQGAGGRVELPFLPDKLNPIELGDWLCLIGPIMKDISVNSSLWWKLTMERAQAYYDEWRHSTPVQRVRINPTLPPELCTSQFTRTEQRGMGLLLRSLTEDIRKVVLANRDLTSTHIIWRLLITYQPGGSGEKGQLLSTLTTMPSATSAGELATLIRHWRRSFQRAQEIGTSLPDGTLLIKSLEQATKYLGQLDSQTAFRLAQSRAELGVDARPEATAIWQYSQVILAEAETLHLSNAVVTTSNPMPPNPKVKSLQTTPPTSSPLKLCKHWGSEQGCRFGRQCRYEHPALPDQASRCWLCSSTKHRKQDCPVRSAGENQSQGAIGGSDAKGGSGKSGKGKGGGGGHSKKENNGKQDPVLKSTAVSTSGSTVTSTTSPDPPKQETMVDPTPSLSTTTPASTGESLMGEVAGLLRSLRLQADPPPSIKACQVRKLQTDETASCLLDGGATHCLRQCRSEKEWREGREVSVALAHGDVVMKQNVTTGTLLCRDRVQPIVPLSQVAALGYRVCWTAQQCVITHPSEGELKIVMDQGCPTVDFDTGLRLMEQVEQHNQKLKVMKMVMEGAPGDGSPEQQRWQTLRELFPEVPADLLRQVPGRPDWRGENLPFNRHVRRRVQKAKFVVVHVFSGQDDGFWKSLESQEVAVLAIDLLHGGNLHDPDLSGYLEDLAISGKIGLWLSGPPCRSVSASRHRQDGGPTPVRGRLEERFGLAGLSNYEEMLVNGDTVLWLKNLWWMWLVAQNRSTAEFLVEQPQDPQEWKDEETEFPSFTVWPETERIMQEVGLSRTRVHQGALGHLTVKPTVLLTNIKEVQNMDGLQVSSSFQSAPWPSSVEERVRHSKKLAAWAPGLKTMLAKIIQSRVQLLPHLRRLSKADKEAIAGWQAHFDCGHLPFRHDCSVCLQGAGKDRQRRRLACQSSFCMSLDVAGPFQPGVDQAAGAAPRYFLVANVSIPVSASGPMVQGLQDLGFRVKPPSQEEAVTGEQDEGIPSEEAPLDDPMSELDETVEEGDIPVVEEKHRAAAEQRWKEFLTAGCEAESRVLTFAVPLVSRNSHQVVERVAWIYARVRSMNIPILRLHTDRAREFASSSFARWCSNRDILHTMSPGDEPTQNARVERTIGLLKNRVRTLIKASGASITWWPLALRHAAECMLRSQLWQLGIATPTIPGFGVRAVAKSKTWHHRGVPWKFPGVLVRVWGPASDMSLTSGGVLVQDEQGRWLRTTWQDQWRIPRLMNTEKWFRRPRGLTTGAVAQARWPWLLIAWMLMNIHQKQSVVRWCQLPGEKWSFAVSKIFNLFQFLATVLQKTSWKTPWKNPKISLKIWDLWRSLPELDKECLEPKMCGPLLLHENPRMWYRSHRWLHLHPCWRFNLWCMDNFTNHLPLLLMIPLVIDSMVNKPWWTQQQLNQLFVLLEPGGSAVVPTWVKGWNFCWSKKSHQECKKVA